MKIVLVTIQNANNYGAILQTYAMQESLKEHGSVEILNYENKHISRSFDLLRIKFSFHGLLGFVKDVFRLFPRYRVIRKFHAFIEKHFDLTVPVNSEALDLGAIQADVFVAGSDQLWNPKCVNAKGVIDTVYYLGFVNKPAVKLSYASSIGGYQFSDEEKIEVERLLGDFKSLAVREIDTKSYLETIVKTEVQHVLDPTLLLDKKAWKEKLGLTDDVIEKYILLYTVPKIGLIKHVVAHYKTKLGLKVVAIDQGVFAGALVDEHIRDAGPKDFAQLFYNASFVITDSFHGTCFALNFEKPFVSVSQGVHQNRISSLLTITGLSKQLVGDLKHLDSVEIDIDFKEVIGFLSQERKESKEYLNFNLDLVSLGRDE